MSADHPGADPRPPCRGYRLFNVGGARYMANRIRGAELVILPGQDHAWFVQSQPAAREIECFLTGIWTRGEWNVYESDRVLATVLFTDITDSTVKLASSTVAPWLATSSSGHNAAYRVPSFSMIAVYTVVAIPFLSLMVSQVHNSCSGRLLDCG